MAERDRGADGATQLRSHHHVTGSGGGRVRVVFGGIVHRQT
jgi:hypothetical protein